MTYGLVNNDLRIGIWNLIALYFQCKK